jgi:hypothetical protein
MAPKKAKVSLPPLLFTDAIHSDKIPLELSPLTPLSTDLEESIMAPTQSVNDFWHRYASQGFRLPGEPEEALQVPGPQHPGRLHIFTTTKQRANTICITELGSDIQIKLTDGMKKIIDAVSGDIILTWPPYPEEAFKNTLLLVNPYAFVTQAFKPKLQPILNKVCNLQQVGKRLPWCICNI